MRPNLNVCFAIAAVLTTSCQTRGSRPETSKMKTGGMSSGGQFKSAKAIRVNFSNSGNALDTSGIQAVTRFFSSETTLGKIGPFAPKNFANAGELDLCAEYVKDPNGTQIQNAFDTLARVVWIGREKGFNDFITIGDSCAAIANAGPEALLNGPLQNAEFASDRPTLVCSSEASGIPKGFAPGFRAQIKVTEFIESQTKIRVDMTLIQSAQAAFFGPVSQKAESIEVTTSGSIVGNAKDEKIFVFSYTGSSFRLDFWPLVGGETDQYKGVLKLGSDEMPVTCATER